MLLAPMLGLLSIGVLMNRAVLNQAHCITSGVILGPIPDELTVTTKDGTTFTLNKQQLTHVGTITTVGANTPGVARDGILIALMAALTESTLRHLANTGTYPESGDAQDTAPGDVTGQGVNEVWYLLSPSGESITEAVLADTSGY